MNKTGIFISLRSLITSSDLTGLDLFENFFDKNFMMCR
jgi:hypothetical protein